MKMSRNQNYKIHYMQWLQNTQNQNQITPYQTNSSIKRSQTWNSDIPNSEKLHDNHQTLE